MRRFFLNKNNIKGDSVTIDGNEFLHISRVLRLKPSDKIVVCLGDGTDHHCMLEKFTTKTVTAKIEKSVANTTESKTEITFYLPLLKGDKSETVLQKAVEFGVKNIVPYASTNATVKATGSANKSDRFNRIALEAAKQCGRAVVPYVAPIAGFDEMLAKSADNQITILANEALAGEPVFLASVLDGKSEFTRIGLIIGCEGGFTREEVEKALSKGVKTFSLGKRILRAETACVAGITLLLQALGEM